MVKVLVFSDDYAEGTRLQTVLKKVGFDVTVANHVARLNTQILNTNPDIVISFGAQKISGLVIMQRLRELNFFKAKAIVVLPKDERPPPGELVKARADVLMEAPVASRRLIEVLARLAQMDPEPLLAKYAKAILSDKGEGMPGSTLRRQDFEAGEPSELQMVQGGQGASGRVPIEDHERTARYQKFLQGVQIDKQMTSHSRQAIRDRQNELQKGWDGKVLEEIDKLRRQFVAALFKK